MVGWRLTRKNGGIEVADVTTPFPEFKKILLEAPQRSRLTPTSHQKVLSKKELKLFPIWYAMTELIEPRKIEYALWESLENYHYKKLIDHLSYKYEESEPDEMIEEKERFVIILNYWGLQYLNENKYAHALQILQCAEYCLTFIPGNWELRKMTLLNLARYFKQRRKIVEALRYLDMILKVATVTKEDIDPTIHINYGVLLCHQNKHVDAVRYHFNICYVPLHQQYSSKETKEALALLVVLYFNTWVARKSLKMRNADDYLLRAMRLLQDASSNIQPMELMKKVEDQLTTLDFTSVPVPLATSKTVEKKEEPFNSKMNAKIHSVVKTQPRLSFHPRFADPQLVDTPLVRTIRDRDYPDFEPPAMSLAAPLFQSRPQPGRMVSHYKMGSVQFQNLIHGIQPPPSQPRKRKGADDDTTHVPTAPTVFDSNKVIKPIISSQTQQLAKTSRLNAIAILKRNIRQGEENQRAVNAAIKIQSYFRGWSIRQQTTSTLLEMERARRDQFHLVKGVVINVQKAVREWQAATRIQSFYRGYSHRQWKYMESCDTDVDTADAGLSF